MALFDWLPATRGQVKALEGRMATNEEKELEISADLLAVKGDLTTIATGVTGLKDQVQALKDQIAAGGDPSAALDQLLADAAAQKVQADAVAGLTA